MARAQVGEQYQVPTPSFPDPFTITCVCPGACPAKGPGAHVHMSNPRDPTKAYFELTTDLTVGRYGYFYKLVTPVVTATARPAHVPGINVPGIMSRMPNWTIQINTGPDKPVTAKRQVSHNGKTDWVDYDRLLDSDDFESYEHRRMV